MQTIQPSLSTSEFNEFDSHPVTNAIITDFLQSDTSKEYSTINNSDLTKFIANDMDLNFHSLRQAIITNLTRLGYIQVTHIHLVGFTDEDAPKGFRFIFCKKDDLIRYQNDPTNRNRIIYFTDSIYQAILNDEYLNESSSINKELNNDILLMMSVVDELKNKPNLNKGICIRFCYSNLYIAIYG